MDTVTIVREKTYGCDEPSHSGFVGLAETLVMINKKIKLCSIHASVAKKLTRSNGQRLEIEPFDVFLRRHEKEIQNRVAASDQAILAREKALKEEQKARCEAERHVREKLEEERRELQRKRRQKAEDARKAQVQAKEEIEKFLSIQFAWSEAKQGRRERRNESKEKKHRYEKGEYLRSGKASVA